MKGFKKRDISILFSCLSFIPFIGVLFGLINIAYNSIKNKKKKKRNILISIFGIFLSINFSFIIFQFGFFENGGVWGKFSVTLLTRLVHTIEYYKIENGEYPVRLTKMKEELSNDSMIMIYDPLFFFVKRQRVFYYRIIDKDHYYLFSVGVDNKPFTEDDIYPNINVKKESKIGLVIKKE